MGRPAGGGWAERGAAPALRRSTGRAATTGVEERPGVPAATPAPAAGRPGPVLLGPGRHDHEPADQHGPQPEAAVEGGPQAEQHQGPAPVAADGGGGDGGPVAVAGPLPQQCLEDPAAVEGERRQQVEHRQRQVDHAQPGRPTGHQARSSERREGGGHAQGAQPDGHTHRRAGGGDAGGGARLVGVAVEAGHPAQGEQGDAPHRYPVSDGHQRVAELVGDQRGQEQGCHHQSGGQVGHGAVAGEEARQHGAAEADDEDEGDGGDRPVEADRDASETSDAERSTHGRTFRWGVSVSGRWSFPPRGRVASEPAAPEAVVAPLRADDVAVAGVLPVGWFVDGWIWFVDGWMLMDDGTCPRGTPQDRTSVPVADRILPAGVGGLPGPHPRPAGQVARPRRPSRHVIR